MEANLEKIIHMRIKRTMENLKKNGIDSAFVPTGTEALALLKTMLVEGETLGVGGSVTLDQIKAFDVIRDPKYKFIDRYEKGLEPDAFYKRKQECVMADTFITSTNAITETGLLYNVDGTGNRACAFVFGPKRVIVIAGYNKIVPTIEDAVVRVKTIAAPANAIRLGMDTYCAKHGHCVNMSIDKNNLMFPGTGGCDAKLCSNAVVTGKQIPGRMVVIIVGESLGY